MALADKGLSIQNVEKIGHTSKNIHKPEKRGLTFPEAFGILTKLSGTRDTERDTGKQKILKKSVDKQRKLWYSISHPPGTACTL